MPKALKVILIVLLVLLAVVLIGPFLVPVPPLTDTVPPRDLADPDSRFVEVNGVDIHYKIAGQGEPALVLLHGFGASTYTWREVMGPLAEDHLVVAFDRPAFGLTERPMPGQFPNGVNPYTAEAQTDLTVGLMDALGIERAVLVGNSAGGTVATYTALRYPERVQALVLVDAAIYAGGGSPGFLRPLFNTPQMRHLGPLIARRIQEWGYEFGRSAWHDPSRFTDEIWKNYTKPLKAENWDRALWELTRASRPLGLAQRLDELTVPVLVITGDDDRIVPTEQSVRLASEIPGAELVVIPNCGHVPQEECPEPFLEAVNAFLAELP
ncbi:MAG: alpha/beta hydrolase [Caldilineales bacterium]|nr:alpha/beta hydrolase [Caldilineales bacterium]MDW8319573.1 alpha/beta hydrolase [Anaerolineae bacterium]